MSNNLSELPVSIQRIAETTSVARQQNITQTGIALSTTTTAESSRLLHATVLTIMQHNVHRPAHAVADITNVSL